MEGNLKRQSPNTVDEGKLLTANDILRLKQLRKKISWSPLILSSGSKCANESVCMNDREQTMCSLILVLLPLVAPVRLYRQRSRTCWNLISAFTKWCVTTR